MDEFLSDIYVSLFYQWILHYPYETCRLDRADPEWIRLENKLVQGIITFNPKRIIELTVLDKQSQENIFYIHFQMKNLAHAKELFEQLLACMQQFKEERPIKVLLCCSGGLTTSFFAMQMQKAAKLQKVKMEIRAVGYADLYYQSEDQQVILLAPQLSYMHAKVQKLLKNQLVLKIPPSIYATYDAISMVNMIQQVGLPKPKTTLKKTQQLKSQLDIRVHCYVLGLSICKSGGQVFMVYRLYGSKQSVRYSGMIIKQDLTYQDIEDVLDTILAQFSEVAIIGISVPALTYHGKLISGIIEGMDGFDLGRALQLRYRQKIRITNDVNNAALGYYASHQRYSSVAFLFQPIFGHAGCGIVIDGKLHQGYYHFAGEVKHLPLTFSEDPVALSKTPEGTRELLGKLVATIVCTLAPEAIALYSDLVWQIQDIEDELKRYLPDGYHPHLEQVDILEEYILLGIYMDCLQVLGE